MVTLTNDLSDTRHEQPRGLLMMFVNLFYSGELMFPLHRFVIFLHELFDHLDASRLFVSYALIDYNRFRQMMIRIFFIQRFLG